jgi:Concanavalin A-like lectin/glucanases superfamily
VLEAVGIKAPEALNGVTQKPIDGISLAYSFTQKAAPSARRTQLYEMMENFGIYHDGWMAGTLPKRTAWEVNVGADRKVGVGMNERQWTLFNLDKDFSSAIDLAAKEPAKLKEMQGLFWTEADKNNLLPIHDYSQGTAGRPSLGRSRTRFSYPDGVTGIWEDAAPHTIGKSFTIAAHFDVGADGSGALVAQGGRFGGYSLYLKSGVPRFHYNAVGSDQFSVTGAAPLAPGKHVLTMQFRADAAKPGSGGTAKLLVDGKEVGSGRIGRTVAGWMTHTDAFDIGVDLVSAVSPDYTVDTSRFSGKIDEIVVTIDPQ